MIDCAAGEVGLSKEVRMADAAGNPNANSEALKWIAREYDTRTREISMRIEQRQQLLNYTLLAIGGLGAFLGYGQSLLKSVSAWSWTLAIVASGVFLLLALGYLKHDLQVAFNAEYIETRIRPYLLDCAGLPDCVLGWERFMNAKREFPSLAWVLHALLEFVSLLIMLIPFASLYSYSGLFLWTHRFNWRGEVASYQDAWFWTTIPLAVGVFAGLVLTVLTLLILARAQWAISRGAKSAPGPQALSAKLDGLAQRVGALEACRAETVSHLLPPPQGDPTAEVGPPAPQPHP